MIFPHAQDEKTDPLTIGLSNSALQEDHRPPCFCIYVATALPA
jgi:hypothetical protein